MTIQADLLSILFFIMLTLYGIIGTYVLSLNPKSRLNRLFFMICISLSVWAFSLSIGNAAGFYEKALFWRRIASFGWGSLYSLLFHFFLVLTENKLLQKYRITYVFIYLTSIVNIILFGIYSPVANAQYKLILTESGWINASVGGLGNLVFSTNYLLFAITCLIAIWRWKGLSKNASKKKTAIIVSITFFVGILLGILTDVFTHQYLEFHTPQLGVVFAIIPISGILYSIKIHGLMRDNEISNVNENEILNSDNRIKFYNYLSAATILGGIVNITYYFYYNMEIDLVLYMSSILLFTGLIIKIIPYTSFPRHKQDTMLFLMLSFLIVVILRQFLFEYGNNIVWTIPIIFLLITVVFRKNRFFFYILSVTLLFHLWSWSRLNAIEISVNTFDYIAHMALYTIVAILVLYINGIYSKRLDDHEKQTELQRNIAEISTDFVSVTIDNFEGKINAMLKKSGEYFGVDRAYISKCTEDMSVEKYTNKWSNEKVDSTIELIESQSISSFPWWKSELERNNKVYIEDVEHLQSDASVERELLKLQGVKSLISVPVFSHGTLIGFLGFDTIRHKKTLSSEHQEAIKIMANIVSDALVKVESEKKINFMANYDALTGLSNRTYFNLQLEKMIELASRKEKLIGVLFLDLDEFKSINDTMGHDSGDTLLIEIARRLLQITRQSDAVCRFGGDEFLVMLPHMDEPEQIRITTEKIMRTFEEPIVIKDQEFYVTSSCGVAVYPADGLDAETLIKSADLAMYESKDGGKNRFTFCSPIMKDAVIEKMRLTNDLYRALEREELVLYYQPQINIESGEIIGLEALIRWNHPERGMILPGMFIPLAEQIGLIHKIGEWVVKTACMQNKAWQSEGFPALVMAVNLSVEQFRGDKLVEVVSDALMESDLEPKYLELEITESIAIKEPMYIIGILHQLKMIGVSIAIDDFGTEYSSLSRLKELPIDRLKMAMEFVQGIDKGTKDEAIAVVIINLAKSLGLKVIAEGVESEGQLMFLKKRVCDEVQGYYFYKPMPADEIEKIMREKFDS